MTLKLITLVATRRHERAVVVDVPNGATGDDLQMIAVELHDLVDGDSFVPDPESWEVVWPTFRDVDEGVTPEYVATLHVDIKKTDRWDKRWAVERNQAPDPAIVAVLLNALQEIVNINGSSGGDEGLVATYKDIARLAVAQYEDQHYHGNDKA